MKLLFRGARFLRILFPIVPRWARWGIWFALLPVPGPFDEIVGAIVISLLWIRHREKVRTAWKQSELDLG